MVKEFVIPRSCDVLFKQSDNDNENDDVDSDNENDESNNQSNNQFRCVHQTDFDGMAADEAVELFNDVNEKLTMDCLSINDNENFDLLCSAVLTIIQSSNQSNNQDDEPVAPLPNEAQFALFATLHSAYRSILEFVPSINQATLQSNNQTINQTITQTKNAIKMLAFLVHQLIEAKEKSYASDSQSLNQENDDMDEYNDDGTIKLVIKQSKRKSTKKPSKKSIKQSVNQSDEGESSIDWPNERDLFLNEILELLESSYIFPSINQSNKQSGKHNNSNHQSINQSIWSKQAIDESVGWSIIQTAVATFPSLSLNQSANQSKQSINQSRQTCGSIIGLTCQKFSQSINQTSDFISRVANILIKMIIKNDQSINLAVLIVETAVQSFDQSILINEIIRECTDIDNQATNQSNNQSNNQKDEKDKAASKKESAQQSINQSISRSISTFLINLSANLSTNFRSCLPLIEGLIDHQSYLMRNAAIQIIGELIKQPDGESTNQTVVKNELNDSEDQSIDQSINQSNNQSTHEQLLALLVARCHDTHAFTRSKTLQVLTMLAKEQSTNPSNNQSNNQWVLSNIEFESLAACGLDRIVDSSSHVRRSAIQLLDCLIDYNRIGPIIDIKKERRAFQSINQSVNQTIEQKRREQESEARKVLEEQSNQSDDQSIKKEPKDEEDDDSINQSIDQSMDFDDDEEDPNAERKKQSVSQSISQSIKQTNQQYLILKSRVEYLDAIDQAIKQSILLLNSSIMSDQIEACHLIVKANQYRLINQSTASQSINQLIWHRDQSIKQAAVEAFRTMYFDHLSASQSINQSNDEEEAPVKKTRGRKSTKASKQIDQPINQSLNQSAKQKKYGHLIAASLIELINQSNYGDLTTLEEVLLKMLQSINQPTNQSSQSIDFDCLIVCLCELIAVECGVSIDQKCAALCLLGMLANCRLIDRSINSAMNQLLPSVIATTLIEQSSNESNNQSIKPYRLQRWACYLLQRYMEPKSVAPSADQSNNQSINLFTPAMINALISQLESSLMNQSINRGVEDWYGFAQQTVKLIYAINQSINQTINQTFEQTKQPIDQTVCQFNPISVAAIMQKWIERMTIQTFQSSNQPNNQLDNDEHDESPVTEPINQSIGNTEALARLFYLIGETGNQSINQIDQLEQSIKKAKKIKQSIKQSDNQLDDQENQSNNQTATQSKSKGGKSKKASKQDQSTAQSTSQLEADLGVKAIEELEIEQLKEQTEHSLIFPTINQSNNQPKYGGLLGSFIPIMLKVIEQPLRSIDDSATHSINARLQTCACLALARVMFATVNQSLYQSINQHHLSLLFSVLKSNNQASNQAINQSINQSRVNLCIAIGDFASRSPNLIEPFIDCLIDCLIDPCEDVRVTAMIVISHLTLNDWIKGRIGAPVILACLIDQSSNQSNIKHSPRVQELAHMFLSEFAHQSKQSINQSMPAIFSHCQSVMTDEQFNQLIELLEPLIDKEKQTISVQSKLTKVKATNQVEE